MARRIFKKRMGGGGYKRAAFAKYGIDYLTKSKD